MPQKSVKVSLFCRRARDFYAIRPRNLWHILIPFCALIWEVGGFRNCFHTYIKTAVSQTRLSGKHKHKVFGKQGSCMRDAPFLSFSLFLSFSEAWRANPLFLRTEYTFVSFLSSSKPLILDGAKPPFAKTLFASSQFSCQVATTIT